MNYVEYIVKVFKNGDKLWYKDGQYHREDGPAVEYANGDKYWFKNGKPHREDGPAIVWPNGDKFWYLDGKKHSEEEYNKEIAKRKNNCQNKSIFIDGKEYVLVSKEALPHI